MTKQEFKFIKGKCSPDEPADIFFYTDVDYWSVDNFICEFDYLVNSVCPSKIRVHINSAGGSCVEGMSVFSKIIDCKIPTECINDALAASMGSIIWAAGDDLFMKDYALLMIHNPFSDKCGEKSYNEATEAFASQLKTIYTKRFGLSDEAIQSIMDGKEGCDGTFLTAQQAVEMGFCKPENIIQTPKSVRDKVRAALNGVKDVDKIKAVLALAGDNFSEETITNKEIINSNLRTMKENEIAVFAALFGLTGEKATVENVSSQINALKIKAEKLDAVQATLDETKNQLTKAQAELAGAQTSVKNLKEDLEKANASLKQYKDAEEEAKASKVAELIDKAVADCKISQDEREVYTKMAQNDFELAKNVLAKIPARDNLGNIIAEAQKEDAAKNSKSEEEKINAKVDEVVGKDFQFRTL